MFLRVPAPLHGWRQFAGEVGVIVLGVLIALAAQQVVELVGWKSDTRDARETLHAEARDNLGAVQMRARQQTCIDRRLAEIRGILRAHASARPVRLDGPVGRPLRVGGNNSAWQIVLASNTLAHMELAEKLEFANAFANYENFNAIQDSEQEAWSKLQVLDDPELIAVADWGAVGAAYNQARVINDRLKIVVPYVLSLNLGQTAEARILPQRAKKQIEEFCRPLAV